MAKVKGGEKMQKQKKSQKEVERITSQVSSGKMTANQAREALGLPKCADKMADMLIKSEKS